MVGWRCGHRESQTYDWLIDWLIGRLVGWLIWFWLISYLFVGSLINCLCVGWLIDWLIDWLIELLIDWLIDWIIEVVLRIGILRRTVPFSTTLLWRKLIYREEKGKHFIQNYDTIDKLIKYSTFYLLNDIDYSTQVNVYNLFFILFWSTV